MLTTPAISPAPVGNRGGFRYIRVAGTPRQMGEQHGEQLRDEIRGLLDAIYHHILNGQPGITGWGIRRGVGVAVGLMETQVPERYRAEIAAMARAADVPYRDLLMLSCFDDVLANLRLLAAMFGRLGCSAFVMLGERTADQRLSAGRNLDYFVMSAQGGDAWAATTYMKEHVVVVDYAPSDRAPFLSVGWPGFAGVATGLSGHGLTASALVVQTIRNRPLATPSCFLYRRVMEEARTLDSAVTLVQRARRTQGHNVVFSSGDENDAAVVEYTAWRSAVRRPIDGWIAATNHYHHPDLVRHHAALAFQSSTERFGRLEELCGDPGAQEGAQIGEGNVGRFLLDGVRRGPEATEYCTILNPCTIYSTVYEPVARRLQVRVTDRVEREFEPCPVARA